MKKFWELFEDSVIIQSTITLLAMLVWGALVLAPLYMPKGPDGAVVQFESPDQVWAVFGVIIGYWFGTKKDLGHRKELELLISSLRSQ